MILQITTEKKRYPSGKNQNHDGKLWGCAGGRETLTSGHKEGIETFGFFTFSA